MKRTFARTAVVASLTAALGLLMAVPALAQDVVDVHNETTIAFYLLCMVLVFLMHPGFAMLEAGMTGAGNASNIMLKNIMTLTLGFLAYFALGWGIMYGTSLGGFLGTDDIYLFGGFMSGSAEYPFLGSEFMFDAVFAATAATIVSGAVAGRINLYGFLIIAFIMAGVIYPVVGHWGWGGGWLEELGFHDFAGSTIVHLTGGIAALTAAAILGPRPGKFGPDGKSKFLPGHSSPLAILGVFMLFMGWFGFNGGSVLPAVDEIDAGLYFDIGPVLLMTALAASCGAVAALVISAIRAGGKTDVSMVGNGVLAGLVAITAGADVVAPYAAILAGLSGGVLVSFAIPLVERMGIDDAVGAFSVHGAVGVLGTVWVGFFHLDDGLFYGGTVGFVGVQILGPLAVIAFVGAVTGVICLLLKSIGLLRLSDEALEGGLDLHEHGVGAYPEGVLAGSTTAGTQ